MSKILGLDLGTNSIGWAVVDDEKNKILGMGSRIFPMGVSNLGEGDNEQSKNAARTEARSKRRQFYRKRIRKRILLSELSKSKMCPIDTKLIRDWNNNKILNDESLVSWFKKNPYLLRAKAVEEKIELDELGRIFYHMIQRRGFQSNSRSASKEDGAIYDGKPKDGKIGILETREKISDTTLGSYLKELYPAENTSYSGGKERIRNRYTTRQMYIDEFETIWEKQKQYHNQLTDELKQLIGGRKKDGFKEDGILFHQRPLRTQKHLIGKCTFEPTKTKCPISAIPFELFRAYQWVNTVECNGKKLNKEEKAILIDQLLSKEKISFKALRKSIDKLDGYYQFNYKDEDIIYGSHTISNLSHKKFFGKDWFNKLNKEQEDIWHVLFSFEDIDKLKEYAKINWGFTKEQAEILANSI